jgi:hypothetical protein
MDAWLRRSSGQQQRPQQYGFGGHYGSAPTAPQPLTLAINALYAAHTCTPDAIATLEVLLVGVDGAAARRFATAVGAPQLSGGGSAVGAGSGSGAGGAVLLSPVSIAKPGEHIAAAAVLRNASLVNLKVNEPVAQYGARRVLLDIVLAHIEQQQVRNRPPPFVRCTAPRRCGRSRCTRFCAHVSAFGLQKQLDPLENPAPTKVPDDTVDITYLRSQLSTTQRDTYGHFVLSAALKVMTAAAGIVAPTAVPASQAAAAAVATAASITAAKERLALWHTVVSLLKRIGAKARWLRLLTFASPAACTLSAAAGGAGAVVVTGARPWCAHCCSHTHSICFTSAVTVARCTVCTTAVAAAVRRAVSRYGARRRDYRCNWCCRCSYAHRAECTGHGPLPALQHSAAVCAAVQRPVRVWWVWWVWAPVPADTAAAVRAGAVPRAVRSGVGWRRGSRGSPDDKAR